MMKREEAFTLVEVVASLVIIGIVLLSVAQLMIKSNDAAAINNEKLVAIDLADTVLQRLKAESHLVIEPANTLAESLANDPDPIEKIEIKLPDNLMTDLKTYIHDSNPRTIVKFNDQQYYELHAFVTPSPASTLNLANILVNAKRVNVKFDESGNLKSIDDLPGKSEIEGYVQL